MAVVVDIDRNNNKRYASINSLSFSSQADLEKADKLDELIKKKITNYVKKSNLSDIKRDRVIHYWEIGSIVRSIYFKSELVSKEERELLLKNVRLHLDKDVFPENNVSRNRNIPEQFFRLAGYPKEIVEKVKWTTWSYLFDSPLLSKIKNFDDWFSKNLSKSDVVFDQGFSRLWFQIINVLFRNVRTDDWSDEILLTLIDSLFDLCYRLVELGYKPSEKKTVEILKRIIDEKRKEFILFKAGSLSKENYLEIILNEFSNRYNNE